MAWGERRLRGLQRAARVDGAHVLPPPRRLLTESPLHSLVSCVLDSDVMEPAHDPGLSDVFRGLAYQSKQQHSAELSKSAPRPERTASSSARSSPRRMSVTNDETGKGPPGKSHVPKMARVKRIHIGRFNRNRNRVYTHAQDPETKQAYLQVLGSCGQEKSLNGRKRQVQQKPKRSSERHSIEAARPNATWLGFMNSLEQSYSPNPAQQEYFSRMLSNQAPQQSLHETVHESGKQQIRSNNLVPSKHQPPFMYEFDLWKKKPPLSLTRTLQGRMNTAGNFKTALKGTTTVAQAQAQLHARMQARESTQSPTIRTHSPADDGNRRTANHTPNVKTDDLDSGLDGFGDEHIAEVVATVPMGFTTTSLVTGKVAWADDTSGQAVVGNQTEDVAAEHDDDDDRLTDTHSPVVNLRVPPWVVASQRKSMRRSIRFLEQDGWSEGMAALTSVLHGVGTSSGDGGGGASSNGSGEGGAGGFGSNTGRSNGSSGGMMHLTTASSTLTFENCDSKGDDEQINGNGLESMNANRQATVGTAAVTTTNADTDPQEADATPSALRRLREAQQDFLRPASLLTDAQSDNPPNSGCDSSIDRSSGNTTTHTNESGPPRSSSESMPTASESGVVLFETHSSEPVTVHWRMGQEVGRGTFGRVFRALNAETGQMFAAKQIMVPSTVENQNHVALADRQLEETAGQRQDAELLRLEEEVRLMKRLRHRHIVRYLGTDRHFGEAAARQDRRRTRLLLRTGKDPGKKRTEIIPPPPRPMSMYIFMEFVSGGSVAGMLRQFGVFDEVRAVVVLAHLHTTLMLILYHCLDSTTFGPAKYAEPRPPLHRTNLVRNRLPAFAGGCPP